jgi:hypothetical protein
MKKSECKASHFVRKASQFVCFCFTSTIVFQSAKRRSSRERRPTRTVRRTNAHSTMQTTTWSGGVKWSTAPCRPDTTLRCALKKNRKIVIYKNHARYQIYSVRFWPNSALQYGLQTIQHFFDIKYTLLAAHYSAMRRNIISNLQCALKKKYRPQCRSDIILQCELETI